MFPVKEGGGSHRDDIMLVQYFLSVIYLGHGGFDPNLNILKFKSLSREGAGAIIPIDGEFKPDLTNWIKIFQHDAVRSGFPLTQDGVVSPADPRKKGMKWYTMQVMNLYVHRSDALRHLNLANDASVPGELKASLKRVIFPGWP